MGKSRRELQIEKEEQELNKLIEEQLAGAKDEEKEEDPVVEANQENSGEEDTPPQRQKRTDDTDTVDWQKRFGDLRRHSQKEKTEYDSKIETLTKRIEELESEPKVVATENMRPPASDETIEEWQNKFPEAASIVETLAERIADRRFREASLDLEEVKNFKRATEEEKARNVIRKAHPDFDDLSNDDEFHDWVEEQPKWVQDALFENSDDARSVIRVLDLYKADKGLVENAIREKKREAAQGVKTKASATPTKDEKSKMYSESKVQKMSMEDFEKFEDEILAAQRNGEFIYDLTGNAR